MVRPRTQGVGGADSPPKLGGRVSETEHPKQNAIAEELPRF